MGNCSRCRENPSYYTRRYSGESLCSSCFKETTVEKVRRTISKYGMLRRGQKVGVAVSGGKDSLSLLKILHELSEGPGGGESSKRRTRREANSQANDDGGGAPGRDRFELVALTVDEGVKGYRDE